MTDEIDRLADRFDLRDQPVDVRLLGRVEAGRDRRRESGQRGRDDVGARQVRAHAVPQLRGVGDTVDEYCRHVGLLAGHGVFARRDFRSKIASIGPGSTSFCSARYQLVQSPMYMRSRSCASRPSPSASTVEHLVHALVDDLARRVETELQPLVLEAVAQLDERDQLARDVAVLTPAADLVVVELGILVPERGRLGVLVHVALPAVRGDTTERAAAVDDRNRAAEMSGELARRDSRRR